MNANQTITFGDSAQLIRDTIFPTEALGKKYIGLEHIRENELSLSGYGYSTDVTSSKYLFRKGDILFGKLRPYFRKVILAPFDGICSTDIWVVRAKIGVEQKFLFYWMASNHFIEEATRGSEGTRMPRAKWSFLSRLTSSIINIDEQKAIAHILGTLDDKIELNQRMNRTLEDIAKAIFKSWFIDFDPVRAKMEGRQPQGMSKEIADLFPDSFIDSALGMIPKGWEVKKLIDVVSYLRRGIQPKYSTEREGVLVLNQKCIRDFRIDFSKARRHDSNKKSINGREIEVGDILINSTGVGTLGRVAQVLTIEEPTVVDSHVTIIRTNNDKLTWNTLGLSLYSRQLEIEALGEGSTGQTELTKNGLGLLDILIPSLPLQKFFDEKVINTRKKTILNDYESLTLSHIRDTLLPKLISGEIRVREAEKILEEIV